MSDCSVLPTCPFFNDRMREMPAMANMLKKKYCHDDFNNCARYQVNSKLGKDKVPADMFPNQHERAKLLLND